MKRKYIDRHAIQQTSEMLKELEAAKRKKKKNHYADLEPFLGEIKIMAVDFGYSKRHIALVLETRHNISFSPDRMYRFFKKRNGNVWPCDKNGRGKNG